jgi:hypothetical protein
VVSCRPNKLAYNNAFAAFNRVSFILAQEGRHQTWRMPNDVTGFFIDERSDSHI